MKDIIKGPISHMLQGLAHWMAYRNEMSNIKVIESDVVLVATDLLRVLLPKDYIVEREVGRKSLDILKGKQRIDLGILHNNSFQCLVEFKLADATNGGYKKDVQKMKQIKQIDNNIDCLVIILYRKSCDYLSPTEFVGDKGQATRKIIKIAETPVKVRRICNSFTSRNNTKSKKTICLEILKVK